ncbi:MAG: hypothetical protein IT374_14115 [Polyangiaceae bacterium]|nr:hypothetical protein [Polyangiaceae bacterium]
MSPRALLALVALASASACGLPGEPSLTPRVDPGKGPFFDAGAVEVCAEGARVVPASDGAGALGLCVDGPPPPCSSTAACDRGGRCVCGACVVPACVTERDCEEGELCRGGACARGCQADAGCAPGERCDKGACRRPCAAHADCAAGATCDTLDGVCLAATCAAAGCPGARTCRPARAPLALDEPDWLGTPDDAVLVEVTGAAGREVRRAVFTSPLRLSLDADALVVGARAPAVVPGGAGVSAVVTAREDASGLDLRRARDPAARELEAPTPLLVDDGVEAPAVAVFRGETWLAWAWRGEEIRFGKIIDGALAPAALPAIRRADVRGARAVSRLSSPALLARDVLLIYVTVRGVEGEPAIEHGTSLPADENDSVALFATPDGARLDAAAHLLVARRANLRTYLGERAPSVRVRDGAAELLFVAADAAGTQDGLALLREP